MAQFPGDDCRGTFAIAEDNPNVAYFISIYGVVLNLNVEDLNNRQIKQVQIQSLITENAT